MGFASRYKLELILNSAGGVPASVLGSIYMKHSRRSRARVRTFASNASSASMHGSDSGRS